MEIFILFHLFSFLSHYNKHNAHHCLLFVIVFTFYTFLYFLFQSRKKFLINFLCRKGKVSSFVLLVVFPSSVVMIKERKLQKENFIVVFSFNSVSSSKTENWDEKLKWHQLIDLSPYDSSLNLSYISYKSSSISIVPWCL